METYQSTQLLDLLKSFLSSGSAGVGTTLKTQLETIVEVYKNNFVGK